MKARTTPNRCLAAAGLASLFLACGCGSVRRMDSPTGEREAQVQIEQQLDRIFAAAESKDFARLESYHLYGPRFTRFSGSTAAVQDAASTRRLEHDGLAPLQGLKMRAEALKIDVFDTVGIATFILDYRFEREGVLVPRKDRTTMVFVREGGEWKITHEHLSPVSPAEAGTATSGVQRPLPPRVVVSTDFPPLDVIPVKGVKPGDLPEHCSDPDDVQSMVRFLLYANEFEVEGLIASAGTFANVARKRNLEDLLKLYHQVEDQLRRHDSRYPTEERLRSVTWQGRDGAWGGPAVGTKFRVLDDILGAGKDSEASDALIRLVDRPDARPVWVCVWGGSREVAQAIWKVRATRSAAELERFLGRLRLYLIAKQDVTTDWLLETFPTLFIILSEKNYMGMFWSMHGADRALGDLAWATAHVRTGHGPLGAAYPESGWDPAVPGVWEGDTPSFLHLLSGLRGRSNPEQPDQPGWGGQFIRPDPARNHWFDDPMGPKAVYRWREEVQADFARRTEWMRP